jgi:hypothetical protein
MENVTPAAAYFPKAPTLDLIQLPKLCMNKVIV